MRGVSGNTDEERCPLCLGEEEAEDILLDYWETINWRLKFLHDKWLNTNKKVAYRKMLRCTNKDKKFRHIFGYSYV
jgi:hypothetical protein